MTDYFDSLAIGSALLASVIERLYRDEDGVERPRLCFDRATIPIKPTAFMEAGKMFEDLIEETYSDKEPFSEKYFHSNLASFPAGILEILEAENIQAAIKVCVSDEKYYTKAQKLSKTYERKFHCLDQIKAHDYRRPIPEPTWEALQIMLKRFGNYPFRIGELNMRGPLDHFMKWDKIKVLFQVEHFWTHESGAECRAKFDMVWIYSAAGKQYALYFDLKVSSNWPSFDDFWRYKYVWQSIHYAKGFRDWCKVNGYIPADNIWYLIQESAEPYITHARILAVQEVIRLEAAYNEAIEKTWDWIEAGKPVRGYIEQEIVDRYGKLIDMENLK